MKRRVVIIGGGGMVGATTAYALAIKRIAHEIIMIDVAIDAVNAQAGDIEHATAFAPGVRVRAGDYSDLRDDDIVVITCGAPQKPGETRLDLLHKNVAIIRSVVGHIRQQQKNVFILMVANPVDVLTHVARQESGLPAERVMGTGTTLDSARLRVALATRLDVAQDEVQAFTLGEHGDTSFAALSQARVAGMPLDAFPGFTAETVQGIEDHIRQAAYKIVQAGKVSHYGIGQTVSAIVDALQHRTPRIFPVCSYADGVFGVKQVTIGLPSMVSSKGVQIIGSYPLSSEEQVKLQASAAVLRQAIDSVQPAPAVA